MKEDIKKLEKWDLPIGFSMALCENLDAMKAFVNMPKDKRELCIEKAREVSSRADMVRLASNIASTKFTDFI